MRCNRNSAKEAFVLCQGQGPQLGVHARAAIWLLSIAEITGLVLMI